MTPQKNCVSTLLFLRFSYKQTDTLPIKSNPSLNKGQEASLNLTQSDSFFS